MNNSQRLWVVAKWTWFIFVVLFAIFYAYENASGIEDGIRRLDIALLFGAMLLIIAGKLGLVITMWAASRQYSILLNWRETYCIYNLTQLAKYIPGSIWQFVGRIAMLKAHQAKSSSIRDALIAEHAWVIGSALTISVLLGFLIHADLINSWLHWFHLKWYWSIISFFLVIFFSFAMAYFFGQARFFGRWLYGLRPPFLVLLSLILVWLALGSALWLTLGPFAAVLPSLSYVVAAYCFAYVVGFLVPFAPAGIGVREALLILALTSYVGAEFSFFLAAFNRILYFFAEILLSIPCVFFRRSSW
ncbi:hypothetical protein [Halochromatium salexigens]|uniref:hypothetical protein n=1 Tax=Halochromatium salexigens TaxID=49447 RepID=UPI00191439E3|nr:hypothetical protein [Halochromatium salexigens]